MSFLIETIRLGLSNLRLHLLRSILTALGIILGIASVIAMTSIAKGSEQRALKQLEILGARNVILRSVRPPERESMTGGGGGNTRTWVTAYGLKRKDLRRVADFFDGYTETIVPLKEAGSELTRGAQRLRAQAFGTTPDLMQCANLRIETGRFLEEVDVEKTASVCVIGHQIAKQLFQLEDPIGKTLRLDSKPLRVVGVLQPIGLAGGAGSALVGRDLNRDIHLPITTAEAAFGDLIIRRNAGQMDNTQVEISEIYLAMPTLEDVLRGAELAKQLIKIDHPELRDVEIIVPYELLENAKQIARTWRRVMLAIAAIALLVGGIGIMNIMLASVTERTREIGIRRALGATRMHILMQFLVETGVLSMVGGVLGIGFGVGASVLLNTLPQTRELFPTQITPWSIVAGFGVACSVGLVFGIYPANVAASCDPIVALRHD